MGECKTSIEVLPATSTGTGLARVNKFRNHADCEDLPYRIRTGTKNFYTCSNPNAKVRIKNIYSTSYQKFFVNKFIKKLLQATMNSTAYSIYEYDTSQEVMTKLTVLSSVLQWPFTVASPFQYSWYK